jgi:Winged helix DNA-binding domain
MAAVMVDGRIVGTWWQRRRARGITVLVELFEDVDAAVLAGLESEVADLGRFLDVTTFLDVTS